MNKTDFGRLTTLDAVRGVSLRVLRVVVLGTTAMRAWSQPHDSHLRYLSFPSFKVIKKLAQPGVPKWPVPLVHAVPAPRNEEPPLDGENGRCRSGKLDAL